MIKLSNGHEITYVVASGALGFSGRGWWWERPLVWFGLIKPELFTIILKSIKLDPTPGNLCWWKPWTWLPFSPWSCVRFIPGGAVNKVGLTNGGLMWFIEKIIPKLNFKKYKLVVSLYGTMEELVRMVKTLELYQYDFVAYELNVSCPNTKHGLSATEQVIASVKSVKEVTKKPLIVKISADQDYITIARGVAKDAEALDLNSVPWLTVFPDKKTPLAKLEKKVQGGGGGVSGRPAQPHNWTAVRALADEGSLPVIASSIMQYDDMAVVEKLGAKAYAFGAIHLRTPCEPTRIVKRHMREEKKKKAVQEDVVKSFFARK